MLEVLIGFISGIISGTGMGGGILFKNLNIKMLHLFSKWLYTMKIDYSIRQIEYIRKIDKNKGQLKS